MKCRVFLITAATVAGVLFACSGKDGTLPSGAVADGDEPTGAAASNGSGAGSGAGDGNGSGAGSGEGDGSGAASNGAAANGASTGAGADTAVGGAGLDTTPGVVAIAVDGTGGSANPAGAGGTIADLDGGSAAAAAAPPDDWDVNVELDACTQVASDAVPSPSILEFVIDKSTSMNNTAPSTGASSKWEATREALSLSFPTMSPSLAAGEFFYPNADGGCVDQSGGVEIAPLTPEHVQAMVDGVMAIENPTNLQGTPTHDAWREGLRRLQLTLGNPPPGYETAKGYVVLMTDGLPVRTLNCGPSAGDKSAVTEVQFDEFIADVEQTAVTTGIKTFAIAVPGAERENQVPTDPSGTGLDYVPRTKLSEVAVAGQTASDGCSTAGPNWCHIDMVDGADFVADLQAAVETVLSTVVSCDFTVPTLDMPNVFLDINQVEANYFASSVPNTAIPLSKSTDACASGDWQFINDNAQIQLCDSACSTVQADPGARVQVDFGCVIPQ